MEGKTAKSKPANAPSIDLLKELAGHLEHIHDLLPARKSPSQTGEILTPGPPAGDTKHKRKSDDEDSLDDSEIEEYAPEYDEEYADLETSSADAEEIEVAVDELLSNINEISGRKRKAESLSELFKALFGKRAHIATIARKFEDSINGYFGQLFGDDLRNAREYLDELIDYVNERIAECKQ